VGTRKAAFLYTSDESRERWQLSPPIFPGWQVYDVAADLRDATARFYACGNHSVWGPFIAKSSDLGETWETRSQGLGFPAGTNYRIDSVWNIEPGHPSQSGVVYAGVAPAGLFRSDDWGMSWSPVDSIINHEHRRFWQPIAGTVPPDVELARAGGPPVQSIQIDPRDPNHMYVAISGAYVTLDGTQTWRMFSHRAISESEQAKVFVSQAAGNTPPGVDPAAAHDMHCLRIDPKNPDRLWTQAHLGVFRSEDGGRSRKDVTDGLPSFHGFPIAVTRHEPDAAFVVPLDSGGGNFRAAIEGQLAVHRTTDGGATWTRLTQGLPGPDDYQSVYREAMDTDGLDREGVYFGTSHGQVYCSTDLGEHWSRLPGTLPPVLSVSAAVLP
jgi:hypothetical protein